ncbi:hypothetical protein SprV_0200978500 [Sparganum proliferum]
MFQLTLRLISSSLISDEERNQSSPGPAALGNAAWFSTLDLKSGYRQVEIHPDDRHKTAFTVSQGLYEFQTLPFGLCNAAATFQCLMYRVLQPLILDKCLVYLDDIIVFGRSIDEHNHNLRAVLEALRSAGLTLNPAFLRHCSANFQSQLLQEVCEILEIRKTRTTPYHPEGNGLVERTNRTLHDLLLAFSRNGHEHGWDAHLPLCLLAYRGAVHSSMGFTPHYLWTGRDLRLPADLRYPLPTPDPSTLHEYATPLRGVIRSAHNATRVALRAATQHQKEQFDHHTAGTPHQVGNLVMHYNPVPPHGTSAKLHHPWQGPFTILDVLAPTTFLLRDTVHPDSSSFTAHFSKLKPYRGRLPICTPDSLPVIPLDLVPR